MDNFFKKYNNCLFFAMYKLIKNGGFLLMRKSKYGPFPHFLWSQDLKSVEHFVPVKPRNRLMPPLIFRGKVKIDSID